MNFWPGMSAAAESAMTADRGIQPYSGVPARVIGRPLVWTAASTIRLPAMVRLVR